MRQAQGPAHWTGNPPLSQLWPGSALGALAMLVLNAVCFLKMLFSRKARECHAEPAPRDLPDGTRGTHNKETPRAAASSLAISICESTEALMVSSTQRVRPSNHEGGLTDRAARRPPPLEKGRSDLRHANRGGALSHPRPLHEVTPTPTSLRTSRTSPSQEEGNTAPA
jgi:hypothetical protein